MYTFSFAVSVLLIFFYHNNIFVQNLVTSTTSLLLIVLSVLNRTASMLWVCICRLLSSKNIATTLFCALVLVVLFVIMPVV